MEDVELPDIPDMPSVQAADAFASVVTRDILRALPLLPNAFDFDHLGWEFFTQVSQLRFTHSLVCAVKLGTAELHQAVNQAAHAGNKHPTGPSKEAFVSVAELCSSIVPSVRYGVNVSVELRKLLRRLDEQRSLREAQLRQVFLLQDLDNFQEVSLDRPLFPSNQQQFSTNEVLSRVQSMIENLRNNPLVSDYWTDWYTGFVEGSPLDRELQRRVALIDDTIWNAGPEAVAAEIEKIREEYQRTVTPPPQRFPELEPNSTKRLITNAATISPALSGLSFQIENAQAQFHQFGYNQIPDTFLPLVELPALLNNISSKLDTPAPNTDVEDALRAEVGLLNAKVIALEAALEEALRNKATSFKGTLKEHVAKSLGDWKLYAAIVSGLFLLSGDDLTLKERGENLLKKREQLFGDVDPSPAAQSLFAKVQHAKDSKKDRRNWTGG
ncbi:hypothetical protein TRL7639_01192 [Falsiruegeria litorea R37]|uniref:Uncharacterized protein n=2 Tax=Falsiruegeria litorea TaxID=1280831 RepID=A0A1Y5S481_9RHOB|nr:hypothetical protein TRL7639_01192 [Falsiruegeria litorea R37]